MTNWGSNPDGSGSRPASFATNNPVVIVANDLNPTIIANWIISGRNAQLIIGEG